MLYERPLLPIQIIGADILRKIIQTKSTKEQEEIIKKYLVYEDLLKPKTKFRKLAYQLANRVIMLAPTITEGIDAYAPKYNHTHSFKEVKKWFKEAGYNNVNSAREEVNKNNILRKLFCGEFGGSIILRGTKN